MLATGTKVLVTGATGFLGGALTRSLAAAGVHVRALAHRPDRDRYIKHLENVEIVQGDFQDKQRMTEVVTDCEFVFHTAITYQGDVERMRQINVSGTRNLLEASARAQVNRFIHVSSIAVYGYDHQQNITEDTPRLPDHVPYNIVKAEIETLAREISAQAGMPMSIIRAGMIYGPRSGMWTKAMFKHARRKPTIFIGDGSGTAPLIHVNDVVSMMLVLATHPNAENQTFNCVSDPSPTWREYLGAYAELAGHQSWLGLPTWFASPVAQLAETYLKLRGTPADLPRLVHFVQQHNQVEMNKSRELLDWQPQVSLQEGMQSCIPYLQEQGLL